LIVCCATLTFAAFGTKLTEGGIMIVSMQGNWTVRVKSKNAAFDQRFIITGAATGNGTHPGTVGTTVAVTGAQWTIAIQNNPGTGFQLSDTRIKFPQQVGANYEFEIESNDAGADQDFNDLILTCSTPVVINDFVLYGNVSLYSGRCIFNPCRRGPFVIDTYPGLLDALKNPLLREVLERLYPERVKFPPQPPNPPDPPFRPIVIDLFNEASQPQTALLFQRSAPGDTKARKAAEEPEFAVGNFRLARTVAPARVQNIATSIGNIEIARAIDGIFFPCFTEAAANITLSFDEYDRTASELAGGAYTGTGPRRLLGDTITDMNGNYIFRFTFDMTFPGLEDAPDVAPGEDVNVVLYPDVIVKILGQSFQVQWESAPYYNIPNLRRIDLCLPKSTVHVSSVCFNGSLIGSLGNVFVGGNQNTTASTAVSALRRYGFSNFLEADGRITVGSSLALFSVQCAAWAGTIDMRGCMYDAAKTVAQNTIKTYTIRVRRAGSSTWTFVTQNYKHPRYSQRNLPGYTGDDVGPFPTSLHVDGAAAATTVPAYKNIQREIFVDGIDWEFSNFDRYMQLATSLYDKVSGVTTPGTLHVRVDGYDAAGNPVANATDMIALFVHNLPLNFQLVGPTFIDPAIVNAGCGLYRLTTAQMNSVMRLAFMANDPFGFVDSYRLSMGRCPAPMLALQVNTPNPPIGDTASGATTMAEGSAAGNTQAAGCPGYAGTLADFTNSGLVTVEFQPDPSEGGWIKAAEYFTSLSFGLTASMRVTNGYNSGLSGLYHASASLLMERLGP
jgi:hypothetical protein